MKIEKEIHKVETSILDSLQKHSSMFLKMEIDSLRNYLPLFEKYVLNDNEKIEEILSQWNKTLPKEFVSTPEYLSQKLYYEKIQMASLFRNSTFINCFSLLETKLCEISCVTNQYLRLKLDESDLKRNDIDRTIKFLTKNLELKITSRKEWQKLKLYQKTRNALVHNKGQIKTKSKKSELGGLECSQIVNSLKGISKSADDYIYLSPDFIPSFLDILESFLIAIQTEAYEEILNKYRQNTLLD